jgi:integron integrase
MATPSLRLRERVRARIRAKHYSLQTEKTYLNWIRRFVEFHDFRLPSEMGGPEVEDFLTALATRSRVAASTQNQALAAILFLYREVLEIELPWMTSVVRAKRPEHLPVVLSRGEVARVLRLMSGTPKVLASLMYGSGLRVSEVLRLRVKDIDLAYKQITVRDGKGQKDRITMLPESLIDPLSEHLTRARKLYDADRYNRRPGVTLPYALAQKYPAAAQSWAWYWVFPARSLCRDPYGPGFVRYHAHVKHIQRAVRQAMADAAITKPASCHTFRHCFATHYDRKRLRHSHRARTVRSC